MSFSIPEFGVAVPGRSYQLRPGAYGVLRDAAARVAVVMTPTGGFLPGGGQEPGESLEQALAGVAFWHKVGQWSVDSKTPARPYGPDGSSGDKGGILTGSKLSIASRGPLFKLISTRR